jgi:serine phosphatase RsbU (regulator of sigma subunit)
VLCLHNDSKGNIWVGTSNGLHKFNKETGKFKLYTEDNGLPNNIIYSIEEDSKGRLWVSTNWGLAVLNPETDIITSYDVADGLQSQEFNVGASYKSKSGELFFGGISGFNSFFPDSISNNKTIPKIAITSFELLGSKEKKAISVEGLDEVIISKGFSAFAIEFSALDFTRPEKNQYAYQMQGLSDQWIELGNKHSATFSNLNAGTYYFKLRGSNNDLLWNEQSKSLKIVVEVSFWRSKIAYGFYVIMGILSISLYIRNRTKHFHKSNILLREREFAITEVEKQREELLVKNRSITDSINYAKRLQEAIMPSVAHFKKYLPDSFLLYMPKDIVSGDFYWVNETKNKLFVAVVDCTGHGVPGAFMSIIGIELLRTITNNQGVNDAAEILNRLNVGIIQTFKKDIYEEEGLVKDGMDVAFCVIDKENNILQYAGAFSNLYLVRDSKITEIKGDRYSVGMGNEPEKQRFSSHYIPIQPDDMVYIFTDGYADQFGGPENKKYKFRRFRHLLLNIHMLPLETQRQYIEDSILEWKGKNEQVDDILIIGIKPDLSCLF